MTNVWFTSDQHLQHRAMAWFRKEGHWPADGERQLVTQDIVDDHDAQLAEAWDSVVHKDDHVWVLGDLTANPKHVSGALDWIKARPGEKHLILGNHDPAHPMFRDSHKWQAGYFRSFESVQTMARRKVGKQDGLLSHFPYHGDGDLKEDRATQYRLRPEGLPLIHGHVHTTDRFALTYGQTPQIHVGVDAWNFRPVSLDEIKEMLLTSSVGVA